MESDCENAHPKNLSKVSATNTGQVDSVSANLVRNNVTFLTFYVFIVFYCVLQSDTHLNQD